MSKFIEAAKKLAEDYNALNELLGQTEPRTVDAIILTSQFVQLEGERSAFFESCNWADEVWSAFCSTLDPSPYWNFPAA